jgi:hypothetical protein
MEAEGDLRYCPACIEVNDRRRDGKRRILFLLPWAVTADVTPISLLTNEALELGEKIELQSRLRSYTEISSVINMVPLPRTHKVRKMQNDEKKRLQIVESYRHALTKASFESYTQETSKTLKPPSRPETSIAPPFGSSALQLRELLNKVTETDNNFLGGFVSIKRRAKGKVGTGGGERWEGAVAMATSRRHWTEQCMQITRTEVLLKKNHDAIRVSLRIPHRCIIRVRPMPPEACPIQGYSYFQIDTFAREHYFLVRSDRQLQEWMRAFEMFIDPSITQSKGSLAMDVAHLSEHENFFLARPPCWRLDKRRVLNFRRIVFVPSGLSAELKSRISNPCLLVESILQKALKLSIVVSDQTQGSFSTEDVALWITFLDETCLLQTLDISILSEKERAVLLLNLFHIMVIHGSLVIGPPPAWSSWPSFFNNITYLLCFDIVSIAEMEHNLLRAVMARPSTIITKIPSPHTLYPGMALTQRYIHIYINIYICIYIYIYVFICI